MNHAKWVITRLGALSGKVAIVTGASRGLGRVVARELASHGSNVVLAARQKEQIDELAETLVEAGSKALAVQTDVASETQVDRMLHRTLETFGRVDILINNAGVNRAKPLEQVTVEDFDLIVNTNLRGLFLCTRAVYPHMIERRSGIIVNVGSVLSLKPAAKFSVYCATKFALLGFSRSLMLESREHNVRVIAFLPAGMQTNWYDEQPERDVSWMMETESVAGVLINALLAPPDLVPHEIVMAPSQGTGWP